MKKLINKLEYIKLINNGNACKTQHGVELESKASSLTQGTHGIWHEAFSFSSGRK